ncbi:MAG TPA: hypothetical protein VMA72_08870 [Streptosporangiaceae bacterium]|nr:hypothetical protein [Streptosporangiaceae bacterium]
MGAGADHGAATRGAADQPGEQVIGPAGRALGVILAACGQDPLRLIEGGLLDERRVAAGAGDAAERQLAQVDAVGQHAQYLVGRPLAAGRGAVPAVIQRVRDGAGTEPVADVGAEDQPDHRCLARVGNKAAGRHVGSVAERAPPAFPFPGGGFAFHARDHPVDDGVALELGEHAEHLYQHAADGGGGVERLGGRPERHPGVVQVVQEGDQVAQAAGEPVDPVDQQHVDHPGPRRR